jgi:hypothetical protein
MSREITSFLCCWQLDAVSFIIDGQQSATCIGELGHCQKMSKTLKFADHFGFELPDVDDEVDKQ